MLLHFKIGMTSIQKNASGTKWNFYKFKIPLSKFQNWVLNSDKFTKKSNLVALFIWNKIGVSITSAWCADGMRFRHATVLGTIRLIWVQELQLGKQKKISWDEIPKTCFLIFFGFLVKKMSGVLWLRSSNLIFSEQNGVFDYYNILINNYLE